MEISGISTSQPQPSAPVAEQVALEVEKKAQDIAESSSQEMVESIPDSSSSLGQHVDVTV